MKLRLLVLFLITSVSGENKQENEILPNVLNDLWRNVKESIPFLERVLPNVTNALIRDNVFKVIINSAGNLVAGLMPKYQLNLPQDRCWGHQCYPEDTRIKPFYLTFSDQTIADLRSRIYHRKNFSAPLQNAQNTYGTNSDYLNYLLDYWSLNYDFKERENFLNQYPQFKTKVQGLDIHFIHVKSHTAKRTVPILLIHGWPHHMFEYIHVIKYLMTPRLDCDFDFEIIVPDLPGFGYSEATNKKGLSPYQIGIILKNLMWRLGHQKFYIHAGDVGMWVGSAMSMMYQDNVLGFHTNFPFSLMPQTMVKYALGQLYPPAVVEREYEERMYPITTFVTFLVMNTAYLHMHATRPDTVSAALQDSPAGLASWIIQLLMEAHQGLASNLEAWDGNLKRDVDMNDLLDSIMVYWDSGCIATANRIYSEYYSILSDPVNLLMMWSQTKVPYAAIKFKDEIIYQPDSFIRDQYPNLVQSTTLDYGGHMAGYENPDILSDSIWRAVRKMEK